VVEITSPAPGFGPENIVPVVNRLDGQFDQLGIRELVQETGPYVVFYDHYYGTNVVVHLALPVAEPPAELPAPARYLVLPEVEAAVAVRNGPSASIFPFVYSDLARWADEHGYHHTSGPGREVWVHEVEDIADVDQQVFEIQLPLTPPRGPGHLGTRWLDRDALVRRDARYPAALGRGLEIHGEKVHVGSRELGCGGGEFGEAEVLVKPSRVRVTPRNVKVHSPGPLVAQGRDQRLDQLAAVSAALQTWHQVDVQM
jgi:hypothetical protein